MEKPTTCKCFLFSGHVLTHQNNIDQHTKKWDIFALYKNNKKVSSLVCAQTNSEYAKMTFLMHVLIELITRPDRWPNCLDKKAFDGSDD